MRHAAAVAWLILVVLVLVAGRESAGNGAVLLYGSAAAASGLGVIGHLRLRAARLARALAGDVLGGEALWAAGVRETIAGGGWGVSGRLVVAADFGVQLRPDASSVRRGATPQVWRAGDARIGLGRWRRDITGIRYQMLELWLPDGHVRRFGAFGIVGALPAAVTPPKEGSGK